MRGREGAFQKRKRTLLAGNPSLLPGSLVVLLHPSVRCKSPARVGKLEFKALSRVFPPPPISGFWEPETALKNLKLCSVAGPPPPHMYTSLGIFRPTQLYLYPSSHSQLAKSSQRAYSDPRRPGARERTARQRKQRSERTSSRSKTNWNVALECGTLKI